MTLPADKKRFPPRWNFELERIIETQSFLNWKVLWPIDNIMIMTTKEASQFWLENSERELGVAQDLFRMKHYHWCLFLCQLCVEKVLKATLASLNEEIPYTHDLARLVEKSGLKISPERIIHLNEITSFNLEARYDDYKQTFYHKANHAYTEKWLKICQDLHLWIKNQIT